MVFLSLPALFKVSHSQSSVCLCVFTTSNGEVMTDAIYQENRAVLMLEHKKLTINFLQIKLHTI